MRLTKENVKKLATEKGFEFSFHKSRVGRGEFGAYVEPQFYYVAKGDRFQYVSTLKEVMQFIGA